MRPFELITVDTVQDAVKAQSSSPTAQQGAPVRYIAGGTNLVDYMKLNVETPRQLVDINGLDLSKIESLPGGGLRIGALARNSAVAYDETVKQQYPVLSLAILSGASTQLRIWLRLPVICCRKRGACTIATQPTGAISVNLEPDAPPSVDTIV
jgi:xanthine dehydrogenase YagS FAD-binding subunit